MIILNGEVRKTIDHGYVDKKTGEEIEQGILVLEPENSRQNYEIFFTANQIKNGARKLWDSLKGKKASISVSLYVNHDYKFYKFTATNDAKPIGTK